MIQDFQKFQDLFKKHEIRMTEGLFDDTIYKFSFFYNTEIKQKSEFIIIDQGIDYINTNEKYFILCFNFTLLIINQSELYLLQSLLLQNNGTIIYCLKNSLKDELHIKYNFFDLNISNENQSNFIDYEISNFKSKLNIKDKTLIKFWETIKSSISGFLIKQSYIDSFYDRISSYPRKFEKNPTETIFSGKEFISLRYLTPDYLSLELIYHIKKRKLFVIKNLPDDLFDRERGNYLNLDTLFLLKYYGYGQLLNNKFLVFEFINGHDLYDIKDLKLTNADKFSIIYELISSFIFIHAKNYIYRDLKPNNIMIDKKNTAILIDLDRMIKGPVCSCESTQFMHSFYAPEIESNSFTNSCDIYSLGLIIYYLMTEKEPNSQDSSKILMDFPSEFPELKKFCEKCIQKEPTARPTASKLADSFFKYCLFSNEVDLVSKEKMLDIFDNKIIYENNNKELGESILSLAVIHRYYDIPDCLRRTLKYYEYSAYLNNPKAQFFLGKYYENIDKNKSFHYYTLAANSNNPKAQFFLGKYYENIDKSKSFHYYTLAADQNLPDAQYKLAHIYYFKLNKISKAIQLLAMLAKNNHSYAQVDLALIYLEGKYVEYNIDYAHDLLVLSAKQNNVTAQMWLSDLYFHENKYKDYSKAVYYNELASKQDRIAQYNMGNFYLIGFYCKKDINKAIKYFNLSADQNYSEAQFMLGKIYYEGKLVNRNIEKSIKYFTLASTQNHAEAQYYLGHIYYDGYYVNKDINKVIYYFTKAADNNYADAQYDLGVIYYRGEYVKQNINKSIIYFTQSANQNQDDAQNALGIIYYEGKHIKRNVQKALDYLIIAANQNNIRAQFNLGDIYYEGKFVPGDINKSIHYFSLAANKNSSDAQYKLGIIYYNIKKEYVKAIEYLEISASNNNSNAQFALGKIYEEGQYFPKQINKALNYYKLAASQQNKDALFYLGYIYDIGKYSKRDSNKAIYYYSLAANQNDDRAQFCLGYTYYGYENKSKQNLFRNKAINYLLLSADQKNIDAQYFLGILYYEGKFIQRDIKKAIHYFKENSNLNDHYSKNNLGIIYKCGDGVEKNISMAIEYFKEAININNDHVAMFNLAHTYLFEKGVNCDIDIVISLLMKAFVKGNYFSYVVLCYALIRKYPHISFSDIENEFLKNNVKKCPVSLQRFYLKMMPLDSYKFYGVYDICLVYDIYHRYKKMQVEDKTGHDLCIYKNINKGFYDGFGI